MYSHDFLDKTLGAPPCFGEAFCHPAAATLRRLAPTKNSRRGPGQGQVSARGRPPARMRRSLILR